MVMPAASLRLKKFRRRFGGVTSPVVVRGYRAWHLVLLASVVLLLLLMSYSQHTVGDHQEAVVLQLAVQAQELKALRTQAEAGVSALSIERATQRELLAKVRQLEQENASLKEDLLMLERLLPADSKAEVLRVERFAVNEEGAGIYHYRALFAYLPGKLNRVFSGRYRLILRYRLAGHEVSKEVPDASAGAAAGQLVLKYLARREGRFGLPEAARLISAEIQVLEGGELKARSQVLM